MLPSLHIGIVGCSAEGASLCYRTICEKGAQVLGAHGHPEITMHTHSLAAYVECLDRNNWDGVAELMLDSAQKLYNAPSNPVIEIPDVGAHASA